ncbi:MAG: tetratricopeptide repeat protein [Spirochaetia bacterium]|nr:tetratricopeptide repeat protein [Spirochaetia bacterium]
MSDSDFSEVVRLNNLGYDHFLKKEFDEAIKCYDQALALCHEKEQKAGMLYNKGMSLMESGKHDEGAEVLNQAASMMRDNGEFLNECGLLCFNNKCNCEAGYFYGLAEKAGTPGTSLLNNIGVLNFVQGNYKKAADYFQAALEADRNNSDARLNLEDTREVLGDC